MQMTKFLNHLSRPVATFHIPTLTRRFVQHPKQAELDTSLIMAQLFDIESYYSHLKTNLLGRHCVYLEKVGSTIDVAANEHPNTIVLAREQSNGRGQRSNIWQSPLGCAMGSIRLTCSKMSILAKRLCFIQHIMGLAAAKTLEQIDSVRLGKSRIKLKWPNDIIYFDPQEKSGKKIGGVLVHTTDIDNEYFITLSFGLNVFNSQPTTCIKDILGTDCNLDLSYIVADMVNRLEQYTYHLDEEKFQQLKLEYTERCIQINRLIDDETNGTVKVREVSDDGYLIGERCTDQKLCTVTKILNSDNLVI